MYGWSSIPESIFVINCINSLNEKNDLIIWTDMEKSFCQRLPLTYKHFNLELKRIFFIASAYYKSLHKTLYMHNDKQLATFP